MENKYSLHFLANRNEKRIVMWKYLNGLLCLQFKRRKWVLDYGKIGWYCGIKSFTYEHCSVLKSDSHLLNFFICFSDSPSKMMKNAFHFLLKALFVIKIFEFSFWLFWSSREIFQEEFFSCYILLTDQISLSGCPFFLRYSNCAPDADQARSSSQNLWDTPDFSFCLVKKPELSWVNCKAITS